MPFAQMTTVLARLVSIVLYSLDTVVHCPQEILAKKREKRKYYFDFISKYYHIVLQLR